MDASLLRRISVCNCWATTRTAVLDGFERYEDSYAITQEFREWINYTGENTQHLKQSVLKVPLTFNNYPLEETMDPDEMLEI